MGQNRRVTSVRTVLDTNVLVSALLFHHCTLAWLRGAWRSGPIRPEIPGAGLAGNAEVLVTGDVGLLASADRFAVPILSSGQFGQSLDHEESVDR